MDLMNISNKLSGLNPTPWVKKGWTQIFSNNQKISSISDLSKEDEIDIRLLDGLVKAQVTKTEKR